MLKLNFVDGESGHIGVDVGEGPTPLSIAQHCETIESPHSQNELCGGIVVECGSPRGRIYIQTGRIYNILPSYVEIFAGQCVFK